jgi:hypothetical protein
MKRLSLSTSVILLITLPFALFGPSSSNTKNDAASVGEKAISKVVKQNYPGAKYSVTGQTVTLPGETYNKYSVHITKDYEEASYKKFNKDACTRLGDNDAELVTTISKGSLSPQQGMGDTCRYWLETK